MNSLDVAAGATLYATGSQPLMIVVATTTIDGTIDVSAGCGSGVVACSGAGGGGSACNGADGRKLGMAAGGARLGGDGGNGGVAGGGYAHASPPVACMSSTLEPLVGGGNGGTGSAFGSAMGGFGGGGGGAVQLTAVGAIVVTGQILSLGNAGTFPSGFSSFGIPTPGGGGAGGGILLEAPAITVASTAAVVANGGGGGGETTVGQNGQIGTAQAAGGDSGAGSGGALDGGPGSDGTGGGAYGVIVIHSSSAPDVEGIVSPAPNESCLSPTASAIASTPGSRPSR